MDTDPIDSAWGEESNKKDFGYHARQETPNYAPQPTAEHGSLATPCYGSLVKEASNEDEEDEEMLSTGVNDINPEVLDECLSDTVYKSVFLGQGLESAKPTAGADGFKLDAFLNRMETNLRAQKYEDQIKRTEEFNRFLAGHYKPVNWWSTRTRRVEGIEENWVFIEKEDHEIRDTTTHNEVDYQTREPKLFILGYKVESEFVKKVVGYCPPPNQVPQELLHFFGYEVQAELVKKALGFRVPTTTIQRWWDSLYESNVKS